LSRSPERFLEADVSLMKTRSLRVARVLAAFLLASACGGRAVAADKKGDFALHGVGALECRALTVALLKGDAAIRGTLASWLLGYISAMNRVEPETYDATPVQDPGALVNMVVAVCQKNAKAHIETVVYSVLKKLEKAKVAVASPEVRVAVNGRATVLRKETLAMVERVLIARGYLKGTPDGAFSAATAKGVENFQKAEHLPRTGLPDPATIVRALLATPVARKK
jgi:hypothetical protein